MDRTVANHGKIKRNRIPRPFLKWAGGKSQILSAVREFYPNDYSTYFEPFIGGGAVYFDLAPLRAVISDSNSELINCYQVVKNDVTELIARLKKYVYDKERYYRVRNQNPKKLSPVARAARTIYLNKTGYNGLFRVNSKGKFNVPFGRYKNPLICDKENLLGCAKALQSAELKTEPFENVLKRAQKNDFVYFDPPYIPVSDTANFTAYHKKGFAIEDQKILSDVFKDLNRRGVKVLLSNSAVPWIFDQYHGFNIQKIDARRNINSNKNGRGMAGEVLISNY